MRCKVRKLPYYGVKVDIKIPTLADTIVSDKGRYYGAGDRTRTCTLLAVEPKGDVTLVMVFEPLREMAGSFTERHPPTPGYSP